MKGFKEFNNKTINEILTIATTVTWAQDLVIRNIFINNLQEWVEVKSVDCNKKDVNFTVSKYGVIYYNNDIYMLDEFVQYLNSPEYSEKFI